MNHLVGILHEGRYLLRDRAVMWSARALLFASALTLLAMAVWWPMQAHHQGMLQDLRALSREEAEVEHAVALARQVTRIRADLVRFEERLTKGVEQSDWIESVARVATARTLRVLSQSVEEGKPVNGYQPLTLTVSVTGNYRAIRDLILAVPDLPVFCVVHELRIEQAADHSLRAQIKLLAFRRQASETRATRS